MSKNENNQEAAAGRLALALTHLRARLREQSKAGSPDLSTTQLSILHRLRVDGPATAASLAAAEHVSQQAIAQSIIRLKSADYVQSKPDPTDGRKSLISMTATGHRLRESLIASRNAWLVQAIDGTVNAKEQTALNKAIELLERLADAD